MDLLQLFVIAACLSASSSETPPHIIFLLADDLGWNDVGFHGSEIPTPNIDALAYSGIVLRRHYAQPSCTPSRAALLTGQYPMRYGLQGEPLSTRYKSGLPTTIKLMPEVLKTLGYQTHLVGKWHLGYPTWSHMPTRRGFDSFFGYLNGYLSYYDGVHITREHDVGLDFWSNETESWPIAYDKYLPEFLSEKAQTIIKTHSKFNKGKPLFLLMSTNAPHAGGNRPFGDDPPPRRGNAPNSIKDSGRRVLADVMTYVDDTLGNLTKTLKSEGMLDNAVIIFLSDNGGPSNPARPFYNGASNFPFRGTKMSAFEGGIRVPGILWKLGLNTTTKTYDNLFHMTDWFPTLNSAAGGGRLEGLDGVDHWAALTGTKTTVPRNELLVEILEENSGGYLKGYFKFVKSVNESSILLSRGNHYYSPPPAATVEYQRQIQAVQASNVARALAVKLDADTINHLRNELMVNQSCSEEDRKKASSHDCSKVGCLFDLRADPNECFDISAHYPKVMSELSNKLKSYIDVMVRKPAPTPNFPNSRNYFAPSSGNTCVPCLLVLTLVLTTCLRNAGGLKEDAPILSCT